MKGTEKGAETVNELVRFLEGRWENVSFEIAPGKPVKREAYDETMAVKDGETITITAHGYRDAQDATKYMLLRVRGEQVEMSQGTFSAKGTREDQVYSLRGEHGGKEFRFRLYALDDRFIFHREIWSGGKIEQVDMSYLVRKA